MLGFPLWANDGKKLTIININMLEKESFQACEELCSLERLDDKSDLYLLISDVVRFDLVEFLRRMPL